MTDGDAPAYQPEDTLGLWWLAAPPRRGWWVNCASCVA